MYITECLFFFHNTLCVLNFRRVSLVGRWLELYESRSTLICGMISVKNKKNFEYIMQPTKRIYYTRRYLKHIPVKDVVSSSLNFVHSYADDSFFQGYLQVARRINNLELVSEYFEKVLDW